MKQLSDNMIMELETMVDATSLSEVLHQLSEICFEKADHISSNWQDQALARKWQACSRYLDSASRNKAIEQLN